MSNLKIYQIICGVFPPVLSQVIRSKIFPLKKARKGNLNFSKVAITGSTFYGNTSDDHSYRFAIHGFFDWRNIIIAHGYSKEYKGDIIEIGANVGTETISYCDICAPNYEVHAFEPFPENIFSLIRVSQSVGNLTVYPKAISNEAALRYFEIPPKYESGIGKIIDVAANEIPPNTIEVETLPLDSYLDSFKEVSLISIDTEGHEPFVLEGSTEVISKFRPGIIIEVNPKLLRKSANSSSLEIFAFFKEREYLCFKIDRFTLTKLNERGSHSKKTQNWLCIPKENRHIIKSINDDLLVRACIPWYFLKSLKSSTVNQ